MLLKELEKIIKIVEKSEIAELEWEKNKERIRIRKDFGPAAPANFTYSLPAAAPAAPAGGPAALGPSRHADPRGRALPWLHRRQRLELRRCPGGLIGAWPGFSVSGRG